MRLLARRLDGVRALVLASYRDAELDRAHPLRIVLGELATDRRVTRLGVPPLSADAVAELAAPYAIDAGELYRQTSGNPFFVTEVLAVGALDVPATVRDAVLARMARLPSRRGGCSRRSRLRLPARSCGSSRRSPLTSSTSSRPASHPE